MTTDQAFEKMIFTRGIYHSLELPQSRIGNLRFEHKNGKISLETKIKLLKKAGYKMKQDIQWLNP